MTDAVERLLLDLDGAIIEQDFATSVSLTVKFSSANAGAFAADSPTSRRG